MKLFRRRPTEAPAPESTSFSRPGSPPPSRSVLGPNTRFRGEVRGRGPLSVRGQLKGAITLEDRLTVEKGGQVEADVHAAELVVAGSIQGTLRSRGTLTLRSTAEIEGKVEAGRLRVEQGARVRGSFTRSPSIR